MIISETVEISINKGNIHIYKKKYNPNIGETLIISIDDLTPGSRVEVDVLCDICDSFRKIPFKLYMKSYKNDGIFCCSKKCSSEKNRRKIYDRYGVNNISMIPVVKDKIRKTNIDKYGSESYFSSEIGKDNIRNILIDKYGVDNPQKNEDIRSKTKKTNLERWGVEYTLSCPDIRDKIKKTNLERYGYEFPSQSKEVLDKIILTNQTRWGVNSPMLNPEILRKSKLTLISNYNVDYPLKSEVIKDKLKKTNLIRRGVEWPTQSNEVKETIKEKNNVKYGFDYPSKCDDFRKYNYGITKHDKYLGYIDNGISLFRCDNGKDHDFQIHYDNYHKRSLQNIPLCTVCNPISEISSIKEKELLKYIRSIYNREIIESYRDGLEIDIYLPDLKIGFEFNGIYWHSEEFKDRNYHLNKTNYFRDKGIQIVHIWEDDWLERRHILESMISNKLKLNLKMWARKCDIREVDSVDIRKFLNENHIQGYINSVVKIGLYHGRELISVMTFDNFEGRKKMEEGGWNLSRFCSKKNINVVGGASRLLKYFITNWKPKRIISYADRDWSIGKLYETLGFNEVSYGSPDYKWVIDGKRIHKSRFRKSNLKSNISESNFMRNRGYSKIWDCGKIKFQLNFMNPETH